MWRKKKGRIIMRNEAEEDSELALREQKIYGDMPVPKAVATMIIPTIISQIITVIYNLADTWYVGLTNNAAAVAAISLCLPVYNIMTAIANLFGIGGSSVITRAIGEGHHHRARRAFVLSVRGALIAAAGYCLLLGLIARPFLLAIGGDADSIDPAVWYTMITMVIGGIPTILSAVFAHLIRSTGQSKVASFGITLGAILNMVLDPLFMFVLLDGQEVVGAAIATALSNTVAMVYFIVYLIRHKEVSIFRFTLENHRSIRSTTWDIMKSGIPSFFLLAAGQISNFFLNGMIADMGASAAVAIYPLLFVIIAVFQAVGKGAKPFLLSLLHKGSLDIVLFFVIRKVFGLEYILWATPAMATVALIVGIILVLRLFKFIHIPKANIAHI